LSQSRYQSLRLILGDQLNASHSWFNEKGSDILYLIVELKQETSYVNHHIQKVAAFFKAMEQFANALYVSGHQVCYLTLDETSAHNTIEGLLDEVIKQYEIDIFEYQLPDEYRLRKQLETYCRKSSCAVNIYETEHFYLDENALSKNFQKGKSHQMEAFYRRMRKQFDVLMDKGNPLGEKWNFDLENRNKLKAKDIALIPPPLLFSNDVSAILSRLRSHSITTIGQVTSDLHWPTNRRQSLQLLNHFCQFCLPMFGTFQDSMTQKLGDLEKEKQWSLYHARLSFSLNTKMLSPILVVDTVIQFYKANQHQVSIAQVEGFVRQILGWREFIRGIYWANMPDYRSKNELAASRNLPSWFWNGNTKMNCLSHAINQSLDFAYAHHIQRLMVTGNFCLLVGVDPDQVDDWYLGIYIDAIEWVELPNTRGMSQFADGGIVGSKAYAASGNYINKMSDYCQGCKYNVKQTVGDSACPLNSLYWQFMSQHEEKFSANPRLSMVYRNWHKKDSKAKQQVLAQAKKYIDDIESL
jgi:deoxyribodipyrimidine photolyase-related protein